MYTTESCPRNKTEWDERSAVFYCQGKSSYACLPNENITELLEFCYPLPRLAIHQGRVLSNHAKYVRNHLNFHSLFGVCSPFIYTVLTFVLNFRILMFSICHALESIYNQFHSFHYSKTFKECTVFGLSRQLKSYKIDVIIKILDFFGFRKVLFITKKENGKWFTNVFNKT